MFKGKRALVTGGGRGIGREITQLLHKCGARIFVIEKSASSVEILRREDPNFEVIQADITEWGSIRKTVESILPIDLLVNNSGVGLYCPFLDSKLFDIDQLFKTHYKSAFHTSQVGAQDLIDRNKPGAIVNVSSVSSLRHSPKSSVYGSTKPALDSLTKYMAVELGPKQTRVNEVNPTCINTDLFKNLTEDPVRRKLIIAEIPLGRLGEKREVADVVVFLLSDNASLINGVTMRVDRGSAL